MLSVLAVAAPPELFPPAIVADVICLGDPAPPADAALPVEIPPAPAPPLPPEHETDASPPAPPAAAAAAPPVPQPSPVAIVGGVPVLLVPVPPPNVPAGGIFAMEFAPADRSDAPAPPAAAVAAFWPFPPPPPPHPVSSEPNVEFPPPFPLFPATLVALVTPETDAPPAPMVIGTIPVPYAARICARVNV